MSDEKFESEKAFKEYVTRLKGSLPGPSSLYEHGFEDGMKKGIERAIEVVEKHALGFHSPWEYSADLAKED